MADKILNSFDVWIGAQGWKSKLRLKSIDNISLEGIARLRELILELAIRGKLVSQDSTDKPASLLLSNILAEKERLIDQGAMKNQKQIPELSTNERIFSAPNGWRWCRLQSLVYLLGDGLHGTPNYTPGTSYFFVNGNNLNNGKIEIYAGTKTVSETEMLKYKKHLTLNTVLVSINGTLGNVAFYNGEDIMLGKSACYFNLSQSVSKEFIKKVIESVYFKKYALDNATGTTIKNLGLKAMNEFPICLPPLAEQHRIVAKVDELMALCDELEQQETNHLKSHQLLVETLLGTLTQAKDAAEFQTAWATLAQHFDDLFITEDSIDQLKQTILQLAVMGKLVKQDPKDEPASELLERIRKENGEIKKQKLLREIGVEEKPFQIPHSWRWVRLGEVLKKITDGTHHSPPNGEDGEYLYISAKNIKDEGVQLSNATYVTKKVHDEIYSRCDPEKGDILYIKDGATTGIATINNIDEPFSMLSSVALLKVPSGIVNNYLLLSMRSPYFYNEMREGMTGVAITRVTLKKLNEAIVSLPPLSEQKRIVAKVDELFALCDRLKERIGEAQKVVNLMAEAVVENV